MTFQFRPDQVAALDAKLDRGVVKTRDQSGMKLSYVEGWHVIAEANRIFGFDGWTRETISITHLATTERKVGRDKRDGFGVGYMAKVRITVGDIVREGTGCGSGVDVDLVAAHESAVKEAETDAMKRAFMTFGNPFGLALYDKTQENVEDPEADKQYATDAIVWMRKQNDPATIHSAWSAELERFLTLPADLQAQMTAARDEMLKTLSARPTASAEDQREKWVNASITWLDKQTSLTDVQNWWKKNNAHIKALEDYQLAPLEKAKEAAKVRITAIAAPKSHDPINLDDEIPF